MILKPNSGNGWLDRYIEVVPDSSLLEGFKRQTSETLALISSLTEDQMKFRYAENKWSIKEIMVHLIDTERLFGFRALAFARKDNTHLPAFDEDTYVKNSKADERSVQSILEEYIVVRTATVALYANFTPDVFEFRGIANNVEMSVGALGFGTLGHEIHHVNVIRTRYMELS
jgi:hypothetical protein